MNAKLCKELRHLAREAMLAEKGPGASLETHYQFREIPFYELDGKKNYKIIRRVDPDCYKGRYRALKKLAKKAGHIIKRAA